MTHVIVELEPKALFIYFFPKKKCPNKFIFLHFFFFVRSLTNNDILS